MNNIQLLAGRYEIEKSIGEGGMADVYLAKDLILDRLVAIKILRGHLADDPVYIQRFKREASAAATLSHPNIVEIYDVGEEYGKYYIVMEYVSGVTLKELVHKRGALHINEAIDIMKQLISATRIAHQNGIIHRDIKPSNVIVTDSGTVKMADFGIATIQSVSQVTQTDAILGSLHYLAPELARGEKATEQSDIYALGIVLYEMLRGEVPFNGETAVNIALKHLREEIPSIREFNPTIPQTVENIILKATVKNLADRYPNCDEMLADIGICLLPKYSNVTKLEFDDYVEDDPTLIFNEKEIKEKRMKNRKNNKNNDDNDSIIKKEKNIVKIMLYSLMGIGTAVIIGLMLFLTIGSNYFKAKPILVPSIIGLTQEEAKEKLEDVGLVLDEDYILTEVSEEYEENLIIASNPKVGREVTKGTEVRITISKGKYIVLEDYVGKQYDEVEAQLKALGITVRRTDTPNDSQPVGTILKQSQEVGKKLTPGDGYKEIHFTVSSGFKIVVPNVVGYSVNEAKLLLEQVGLNVIVESVKAPDNVEVKANEIVSQSIAKDTQITKQGESITITYYEEKVVDDEE